MDKFVARYRPAVTAILNGFDRLVFRGTLLPRNCSPRPVWHDRTRVGTMATLWVWAGRTDDGRRRYVPARSLGSVTVPGLAIARRVASARYPAGSTPASFADSSSV